MKKLLFTLLAVALAVGNAWAVDYVRVTKASDLVAGSKYLIVYEGSSTIGYANTGVSGDYIGSVQVALSSGRFTAPETCQPLILGGSSAGYTLRLGSAGEYIYYSGSGTKLTSNSNVTNNTKWTINFSGNNASIANVGTTTRLVRSYVSGTTITFRGYTTSNGNNVALYKEVAGGSSATEYSISIANNIANGSVSASVSKAVEGTEVTLTATPDKGYKFSAWSVKNASTSTAITVTNNKFKMPAANVTVSATFEEKTTNPNEIVYDFNSPDNFPSGFPTGGTTKANAETFNISGNDIIINAPDAYYIINRTTEKCGLFFGKTTATNGKPSDGTAYLGFPAIPGKKLVKVVATTTASVGGGIKLNIYDSSWTSYSTELSTTSSTKKEFEFNLTETEANVSYRLASGSSGKNLQFDNIVLTYEDVIPSYSEAKALNVTADNGKSLYFTTFSSDKVTFFPEYDDELTFATSIKTAEVAEDIFELTQIATGTATIDEEEVEGFFVPANTGVLVQVEYDGKAEKNVPYYEVANKTVAALENNDLQAGNGETLPAGKVWYKLAWADASHTPSTLGFYYGAADGAPFVGTKGKAYLGLTPEQAKTISFSLADDAVTAIKNVETGICTSVIYNLAGQRVNANTKGIVIMNGKKIFNK